MHACRIYNVIVTMFTHFCPSNCFADVSDDNEIIDLAGESSEEFLDDFIEETDDFDVGESVYKPENSKGDV